MLLSAALYVINNRSSCFISFMRKARLRDLGNASKGVTADCFDYYFSCSSGLFIDHLNKEIIPALLHDYCKSFFVGVLVIVQSI